jgi:hypothetical protein
VFLPVFWTIYIPIVTIMLAAAGEWLIHALRQLRAQARLASSNRRERAPSSISGIRAANARTSDPW